MNKTQVAQFARGIDRPPQILRDAVWYFVLEFTTQYEGVVPYMYNDYGDPNRVTYGIGIARPSLTVAHKDLAYFYQQRDAARTPVGDPQLMDADWQAVAKITRVPYSLYISSAKPHLRKVKTQADVDYNLKILGNCFEYVTKLRMNEKGIGLTMASTLREKAQTSLTDRHSAAKLRQFSQFPVQAQIACVAFWYGCVAPAAPHMCQALQLWDFDEAGVQAWWWDDTRKPREKRKLGISPLKELGYRTLFYNAARMYEQSHEKNAQGMWTYNPQNVKAQKLPEWTNDDHGNRIIKVEPWQPWTDGELDADSGQYKEIPRRSKPADLHDPDLTPPPATFKYDQVSISAP
ncbi:MAG TPA: hypothetical protein VH682_05390 [Gemmataceae bacterium]